MARRIRWQILIAAVTAALVLGLMTYLTLTTAAVATPLAGGVFTEYETSAPRQLNPLVSNSVSDPVAADVQALIFDGLMRIGSDGLPEPALAQAWPQIEQDGTVYTFALRPDVRWHDGQPLSVDDVLFTLRAVQSPGFVGDQQTGSVWRNVLLERLDDTTFRATLPAPLASFLSYATFPILPVHVLGELDPAQWSSAAFNAQPIGTGPYQLSGPLGADRVLLTANQRYFGGRPYLDSIEMRFEQNPQDALTDMSRGGAVGIGWNATADQSRLNTPRNAARHSIPLAAYTTLSFNTRIAPLSDLGLRRALALATDRTAIIQQVLAEAAQPLDTPLLPGWWASDPLALDAVTDAVAAGETLASLGFEVGGDGLRARDGQPLALTIRADDTGD
ncbi:MAG: peptide ABC transporter substrate-binding protein, partial [Roseiflexaceae bacterium]|nr:peptide ABC transporter substrate-binding protein [Roseiflexaceae bacterium]